MGKQDVTMLTVSKVCHEIANHLSIMKFLGEDLKNTDIYEVKELLRNADLLSCTADFFRSVYSVSGAVTSIFGTLLDLARLKEVTISDPNDLLGRFQSPESQNMIAGLLYLVIKACKAKDVVSIVSPDIHTTWILATNRRFLPTAVNLAFSGDSQAEDIFNVFAMYIRGLAAASDYQIFVDTSDEETGHVIKVSSK
ncbi:MAG: hypothetical protein LBF56_01250 [Holosporales bacterium]|jgi:hypothetical protein|nr:hypothetical protein [Holosporales bacterium]